MLTRWLRWLLSCDCAHQVAEVRAFKEELLRQQREMIKQKLHRVESKRQLQLKMKIRKAHEEETKVCRSCL